MSYSQARMTDSIENFPAPPMWLVWSASDKYITDPVTLFRKIDPLERNRGQVRHMPDLAKCKAFVRPHRRGGGAFSHDWSIYCWIDGAYVLQYSGREGELASEHELFQMTVRKTARAQSCGLAEAVDAAIRSIQEGAA